MTDYSILKKGFEVTKNRFSGYWFCMSKDANENGDHQFCFKDLEYQARELNRLLNDLLEDVLPIVEVCEKYNIPIKDLPEVLEEYIAYDNEEYLEKLRNQ